MNLKIEEIVANAIIELNRFDETRKVSLFELEIYSLLVLEDLKSRGLSCKQIKGENATLEFEKNFSSWFTPYEEDGQKGYYLNDNKTIDDLVMKFRKKCPLTLLLSFMDNKVIAKWLALTKKGMQLIKK